jgi:hypothetical protein
MTDTSKGTLLPFFAKVVVFLAVLTFAWSKVSAWTSQPVAWLADVGLHAGVGDWVRSIHTAPGVMEVQTRLEVKVNGRLGDVMVEAEPAHFAYGLPVLWALLLAAAGGGAGGAAGAAQVKGLIKRMLLGMVLLWPFQAFSLCMDLIKKMAMAVPGGAGALRIDQWQLEGIALAYQAGTLMVPTLAPILIWLWLDRRFVRDQLMGRFIIARSA